MEKHWTSICINILTQCTTQRCSCWQDYCLWSKDNPKLSFEQWKSLAKIEYQDREVLGENI